MKKMKAITFEFPGDGLMSIDNIERYAYYANKSIEKWMAEAIAWYIDFHESQRDVTADTLPAPGRRLSPITKLKLRLAEHLQTYADRCLD